MREFRFINFYRCNRGHGKTQWRDEWDSTCNDRCPKCNAETEPSRSTDYPGVNGKYWTRDRIQFPRLIAELSMAGAFTEKVMAELNESMELRTDEIKDLITRAETEFAQIKEKMFR